MPSCPAPDWSTLWQHGSIEAPDGPLQVVHQFETHTSLVWLTAARAYKIRKPVNLGFLDYSSEEKRRLAARTELAIGQRISPQVYLGVWTLTAADRPLLLAGEEAGEPVVAMVRLADELQLEHLFSDPATPVERIDEVAAACAKFHAACPVDDRPEGYGSVAATTRAWTINFEQLPEADATIPLSRAERAQLIEQTNAWLEDLKPQLAQRIAEGRIREGHGDLRLQHVYLTRPWSVIDPLEFSIELRFCDVAAEVCFLAMELDDLRRRDASERLLAGYAEATRDSSLAVLAPFFKRYRAVVRAKVEWIRAGQTHGPQQAAHLASSRRLFELALSY